MTLREYLKLVPEQVAMAIILFWLGYALAWAWANSGVVP